MSEWSYVYAAYGLTWVVLVGYTLFLWNRGRRAKRLLDDAYARVEVDR